MRSSTGRWVIGEDFFDRETDLEILEARVREGNHVLLSGQRRMGKTSVLRELGRRLENDGWIFMFVDVEDASNAEDAVANMAIAAHKYRALVMRFTAEMGRRLHEKDVELSASGFGLKVRAGLDGGSWRRDGESLLVECASLEKPVLLVIDEMPILLKRMLQEDHGARRVDEFLSWLRGATQTLDSQSPVLILSGSIGLEPLVRRLGISDRINYLDSYKLGPWGRETSIACIKRLADSQDLTLEGGVAEEVYERLGVGIPHHVQSFFARLKEHAIMQRRHLLRLDDVGEVYRNNLLGPSGQNDLVHYETRLKDAVDDESYGIAMEILAEVALEGNFTVHKESVLAMLYGEVVERVPERIKDVLEVLEFDGYLEAGDDGYVFSSHLLKDWWTARFRGHHVALEKRLLDSGRQ